MLFIIAEALPVSEPVPAVVGTVNGTAVIWDGSVISVDGTNGLVYLEQQ